MSKPDLRDENEHARQRESAQMFWRRSMAVAVAIVVFFTVAIAVVLLAIFLQEPMAASEKIMLFQKLPSNLETTYAKE